MHTVKGVEELANEFDVGGYSAGYLSCVIALLYFATVYLLEKLGSSVVWNPFVRGIIADYSYVVSVFDPNTGRAVADRALM